MGKRIPLQRVFNMADNFASAGASASKNPEKKRKKPRIVSGEHNIRKRQPQKPILSESVIYVSTKSSVKGLLRKVDELILKGESEIAIYCLGAAIQRGILLALQIAENHSFVINTNTLTSVLIDDLEPTTDEADFEIQKRQNSAVRLILTKIDPLV